LPQSLDNIAETNSFDANFNRRVKTAVALSLGGVLV
jgi:hypothetical protein